MRCVKIMVLLKIFSGVAGLIASIILFLSIYKSKNKIIVKILNFLGLDKEVEQNFCFWLCLVMFDTLVLVPTMLEGGNYWLNLGYTIGSVSIAILLLLRKQIHWAITETVTIILVIISFPIIFIFAGNEIVIIVSVSALFLSYIPQIVDTFKKPSTTPTSIFIVFGVAEILSLLGGEDWSVEERYYAMGQFIPGVIIILFSLRKERVVSSS